MGGVAKMIEELRNGLNGVTSGPWYIENEENDGSFGPGPDAEEGYTSWQLCSEAGVIADCCNSDLAIIETEIDGDELGAWAHAFDKVGYKNFQYLELCSPENIKAILDSHAALVEALERQTENMAFIINHADLHNFHDKFVEELEIDRQALAKAKAPS